MQLPTQVAVTHCRGRQRDGSFVSQGNSKADQIAKQAARLQEPEQVIALVVGPPELPSLPQYSPQEQENAEKWGYEKGSTGWYKKEDKVLIPEAQQWKLTKSLRDATHYGRDALWDWMQKAFSGMGLKRTVKQVTLACDLCAHNNP